MRTRCWFVALATALLLPALAAVASPEATGSAPADEARARPEAAAEPPPPFRLTVEAARAREQENALPLTTFYDAPEPWPQGKAGTLIRSEPCNDYRFPSDLAPAQANDVLYAVAAARQAARQLGARWVAVGHSEGGLAVLKLAEMQARLKDPNCLGVIAIAPPGARSCTMPSGEVIA